MNDVAHQDSQKKDSSRARAEEPSGTFQKV